MKKLYAILLILVFVLSTFAITLASAQEINPPETITQDAPFNLLSFFTHTFSIQQYSVVGDARRCSSSPDYSAIVLKGVHYTKSASTYCSSGYALFDVFTGSNFAPYKEYKDNVDVTFGSSGGNVEVYCCDYPEPTSQEDCISQVGDYSILKTASCTSWSGGYKCTYDIGSGQQTESNIPYCKSSFKYCSENIYKDCYYVDGTSCTKHTYPGVTSCPSSYQGSKLYSSLSICKSNICTPKTCTSQGITCGTASDGCGNTLTCGSACCTPSTCESQGKQCGSWSDGCSSTLNCGTCEEGYTCNSVGYCSALNTTEVPCSSASIQNINIPCTLETLNNCNSACPTSSVPGTTYIAGTLDSCGFHNCILINEINSQLTPTTEENFDINSTAFPIGTFNVSYLMLIIAAIFVIFLIKFSGGKK